jgi:hypothetical protein
VFAFGAGFGRAAEAAVTAVVAEAALRTIALRGALTLAGIGGATLVATFRSRSTFAKAACRTLAFAARRAIPLRAALIETTPGATAKLFARQAAVEPRAIFLATRAAWAWRALTESRAGGAGIITARAFALAGIGRAAFVKTAPIALGAITCRARRTFAIATRAVAAFVTVCIGAALVRTTAFARRAFAALFAWAEGGWLGRAWLAGAAQRRAGAALAGGRIARFGGKGEFAAFAVFSHGLVFLQGNFLSVARRGEVRRFFISIREMRGGEILEAVPDLTARPLIDHGEGSCAARNPH